MFRGRRKNKDVHIDPDEIFIDSQNLPDFDTFQFEGRMEKPIPVATMIVLASVFGVLMIVLAGKAWALQIKDGEQYAKMSESNMARQTIVFAERGAIYDRNGLRLAWNAVNEEEPDFASRRYIDQEGFAHVLGYLKYPAKDRQGYYYRTSYEGMAGIEQQFNSELQGTHGLKILGVDALGRVDAESTIRPAKDGANLTLSIDAVVEAQLYKSIEALAGKVGFTGGAGAIMDVHTGEVIAITSYPEYKSSVMTEGDDSREISRYLSDSTKPFLNRFLSGLYTPGSIVKPFVALAALEEDVIDPNKVIVSTGSISIPHPYDYTRKTLFMDWKAHGPVTMRDAIAVSSNVYFYVIGGGFEGQKGLGIDRLNQYFSLFGIGQKNVETGFFKGPNGVVPSPSWKERVFPGDPWRIGDTYFTSIGQYGFQVTPLQMLKAVASIANDGLMIEPTILKTSTTSAPVVTTTVPVDQNNLQIIREGMRKTAISGTASGLNLPYVKAAAKTGTAELGVTKAFVNSWVTGFFPYENPKYAFVVIMERGPRANIYGSTLVMRELFEWMHKTDSPYLK
ncbi:MAG: penicillin-binding transpeptidase domain-containing protein [bacterium]|nr:penicillin-binding transpeptidase domain-containing protein [bacterium]